MLRIINLLTVILWLSVSALGQESTTGLTELIDDMDSCLVLGNDCEHQIALAAGIIREQEDDTTAARMLYELGLSLDQKGVATDKVKGFYEESIELFREADLPCQEVESHFLYTRMALFQGDPIVTLERAKRCLFVAEKCGIDEHIAHAHSFVGAALSESSQFQLALEHLLEAERMYISEQDSSGLAMVLLDKAIVHNGLGNEEDARASTREAARLYKAQGEELHYAIALIDLCSDYLTVDMTDSVVLYLPIAENIVRGKHELAMAYVSQHYGNLHMKLGEFDLALPRLEAALDFGEKTGNYEFMISIKNFIAQSYLGLQQNERAYRVALESDSIADIFGSPEMKLHALLVKAKTAHGVAKHDLSHYTFLDYIQLNDSLRGIERQKEISALEEAFAAEQRENKIRAQEQENALLAAKHKVASDRNIGLGILAVLLGVLSYVLVNRQRLKVQAKEARIQTEVAKNQNLKLEVDHKNRELTSNALNMARKNEFLTMLNDQLVRLNSSEDLSKDVRGLRNQLRIEGQMEDNWKQFTVQFTETNPQFYDKIRTIYPDLSKGELRMAALLRMNLGNKDIARILSISDDGVKKARYRLRKKLSLQTDDSLEAVILNV